MKLRTVARGVCIVGMVLCIAQMLAIAIYMVMHNRGAETYQNVYRLQISWTSFLIDVAAAVLAVLAAAIGLWVIRIRNLRDEAVLRRQIQKRNSDDGSV